MFPPSLSSSSSHRPQQQPVTTISSLSYSTKAKIIRPLNARTKYTLLLGIPLLAVIGTLMNFIFLTLEELGFSTHHDFQDTSPILLLHAKQQQQKQQQNFDKPITTTSMTNRLDNTMV